MACSISSPSSASSTRSRPSSACRPPSSSHSQPSEPSSPFIFVSVDSEKLRRNHTKKIANSRIKFSNKSQWYGTLGVQNYHQRQEFDGGTPEAALPYHQRPTTEQAKLKQRVQAAQRQDQAAGGPPLAAPRGTTAPPPTGHDCAQSEPKAQPAAADSNNWGPAYVQPHWAS